MNSTRQPQYFQLRGNKPPKQGKESSLAGIAEPGDLLTVYRLGQFVNNGTKAEPLWQPYQPEQNTFIVTSEQFEHQPQRQAAKQAEPEQRGMFGRQGKPRD